MRAPVQRIARHPTNRQLETGEGNQPVGRAPVQCHHQPPRPSAADRELEENSSTGRGRASANRAEIELVIPIDSLQLICWRRSSGVLLREPPIERLREEDARDSRREESTQSKAGKCVVLKQSVRSKSKSEGGSRANLTRSRAAHYDSVTIAWP